jgi:hypothetical protein
MFQSPRTRKIGTAAALFISWWANYWLFSQLPLRHEVFYRVGFVCAALCVLGALAFFWGVWLSYVARWRKWSARKCHVAGISVLLPMALLYYVIPGAHFVAVFNWAACLWVWSGYVCGKLAHPELTDDEAYAPEPPLTLFPK